MSEYLSQNTIEFSNGRDSKVRLFNAPEEIQSIRYVPGEDGRNPEWIDFSYNKHYLRIDVNVNPKEKRLGSIIVTTNLGEHLFDITLLDYNTTIPVYEKDPIRVCVHTTSTSVTYDKGGTIKGWVETIGADKLTCTFAYSVKIGTKTKYNAIWDRWPIEFTIPAKLDQTKTERFIYTVKGTNSNNTAICEGNLLRSKYSGDLGTDEGDDPIVTPPTGDVEEKEKPISLSVSPSSLSWDADITYKKTVTVTVSNADDWDISVGGTNASHFTCTKNGNTIEVTPLSENATASNKTASITVIATKTGLTSVTKTISLSHKAKVETIVIYWGIGTSSEPICLSAVPTSESDILKGTSTSALQITFANTLSSVRSNWVAFPKDKINISNITEDNEGVSVSVLDIYSSNGTLTGYKTIGSYLVYYYDTSSKYNGRIGTKYIYTFNKK